MREQRITTVEQLDALPDESIIYPTGYPAEIYQKKGDNWFYPGSDDYEPSYGFFKWANHKEFRVLWSPPVHDPSLDVHPNCMIGRK